MDPRKYLPEGVTPEDAAKGSILAASLLATAYNFFTGDYFSVVVIAAVTAYAMRDEYNAQNLQKRQAQANSFFAHASSASTAASTESTAPKKSM